LAGKYLLEGKNEIIALKMLKDVTTLLEEHKISYWLEGGTLLGIVRENRLLPWDNDMDISIKEENLDRLVDALSKLKYRVRYKEFEKDDLPFKKGIKRIVKIRNSKFFFFRGEVTLDIFIKFKKDEEYFWRVGSKKKSVPAVFYDALIPYPFNEKEYLVPKLYKEYLTYRYGDWKTPVQEWDTFKDDKALGANV
jgi:phosphorylcholine metabolism protein LicD